MSYADDFAKDPYAQTAVEIGFSHKLKAAQMHELAFYLSSLGLELPRQRDFMVQQGVKWIMNGCKPPTKVADEYVADGLSEIVDKVLAENPKAVAELKAGKAKVVGSLVGSVMKLQKGDPREIQKLIKEKTQT